MANFNQADYSHVERIRDFDPEASDLDSYISKLKVNKPSVSDVEIIKRAGPISYLAVTDPENPFQPHIMHRPDSVVVIPRIYTQKIEGVLDPEVHTLIGSKVFHYGGAIERPNFAAGGIDPSESVIDAALREASVEEIPAVKAEYIRRAIFLGAEGDGSYNSIGGTTERSYRVLLDVVLPVGVDVMSLDGQEGGGDHFDGSGKLTERESIIVSRVEKLKHDLRDVVCGTSDKLGVFEALFEAEFELPEIPHSGDINHRPDFAL